MPNQVILMNSEGWPGIQAGVDQLKQGAHALDVLDAAITQVEDDVRVRTVSIGSAPNALGVMQLDASVMDGNTLQTGAVGAIEGIRNPFKVARKVVERLPHVMLVGAGAQKFAVECGFSIENILTDEAKARYEEWRQKNSSERLIELFGPTCGAGSHGTVVALTIDKNSNFAGGVSTSGWDYKYPGRLGDSPIIGAGMYIDKRYGGAACTQCGEVAIRSCLAHSVVLYMKKGASVTEAVLEGLTDLAQLKGGFQGQVVVYAFDKDGDHFVAQRYKSESSFHYLHFNSEMSTYEKREVVCM